MIIYDILIKQKFLKLKAYDLLLFPEKRLNLILGVLHKSLLHGCSNQSNLEMAAEFLVKNMSYLNLNISRTKNDRNKL